MPSSKATTRTGATCDRSPAAGPRPRRWWNLILTGLAAGSLLQNGCNAFVIQEVEALFAGDSPDNALFLLNSVLFNVLAPLLS